MDSLSTNFLNKVEELEKLYQKLSEGFQIGENFIFDLIDIKNLDKRSEEILEKIAKKLEEIKKYEISYKIYKNLSLFSEKYLGKTIELALIQGDLFLAELAGKKYLKYLSRKKNFPKGFQLIDDLEKRKIGNDYLFIFKIIFSIICGDLKIFEKQIRILKKEDLESINLPTLSDLSEIKWKNFKEFRKLKFEKSLFQLIEIGENNLYLRKQFFNELFEFKCFFPEDNFSFILLSNYASFFSCGKIVAELNEYIQKNKNKITKEEFYIILKNLKKTYSKKANLNVKEKEDFKISALGQKILGARKEQNNNFFINEKSFLKVCELLEDEEINTYYNDLCICFFMMGFFNVCTFILDRFEKNNKNLDIKEKLSLKYLRINILLEEKKFWEASTMADDLLMNYPLTKEELKIFNYLKGESKFFLGNKKEAKNIYLAIKKEFPNYRLVEKRLLQIEHNK